MKVGEVALARAAEQSDQTEGPLVAALAAALVDYRRRTDDGVGEEGSRRGEGQWRLLARWEQLSGGQ